MTRHWAVHNDAQVYRKFQQARHVRFGSKADICSAAAHVRFTPKSDIKCDSTVSFAGERKNDATEYIDGCC
jgi:urease beta subunit